MYGYILALEVIIVFECIFCTILCTIFFFYQIEGEKINFKRKIYYKKKLVSVQDCLMMYFFNIHHDIV